MFTLTQVEGVDGLHAAGVIYRDLKPENILLQTPSRFPRILIADFGFSRSVDKLGSFAVCGTPSYMPPEAIRAVLWQGVREGTAKKGKGKKKVKVEEEEEEREGVDFIKADCWSVGAIVWQMLTCVSSSLSCRPRYDADE